MTRDTSAYPTLRHYITVYGEQTEKLLRSLRGRGKFRRTRSDSHGTNRKPSRALQVLEQTAAGELQPGGKRQDVGHYGRLRRHPTVGLHGWIRRRRTFACAFLGC